jgi:hypothetical protein
MAYSDAVEDLRRRDPGLPAAYLDFVEKVGFGVEHEGLTYYEGLTAPRSIYGVDLPQFEGVKLFADDGQGYCYGFDTTQDYAVVEVNPLDHSVVKVADGFAQFEAEGPVSE